MSEGRKGRSPEMSEEKRMEKERALEEDRNRIADLIRAEYTPEEWAKTRSRTISIDGKNIKAIGTIFGITQNYGTLARLELGRKIWPDNTFLKQELESRQTEVDIGIEEENIELWRARIQKQYAPEDWARLTNAIVPSWRFEGKKMIDLARIFHISGNLGHVIPRLELGLAIWPEDDKLLEKLKIHKSGLRKPVSEVMNRTPEQWRKRIQEIYTPEKWLMLKNEQVKDADIDGFSLGNIGYQFGVVGDPHTKIPRLEIGLAIWPDSILLKDALEKRRPDPLIEGRTLEGWRTRIYTLYTPEKWIEMTRDDVKAIDIDGKGVKALRAIFGIQGDPYPTIPRLELGLAIWPGNEVIQQALDRAMAGRSESKEQEVLQTDLKEFAKNIAEGNGVDAETFRTLVAFCGGARGMDILYQFKPEYRAVHVDFVKNILSEYLGDVLSEKRPFELREVEKVVPYLSDITLQEGLFETLKGDCLSFYYKKVREGSHERDRDIVEAYLDYAVEELGHLKDKVVDDVIERVVLYFHELFRGLKKPAELVDEIKAGRAFPDVNQRINARELQEKKRLLIADEMGLGKSASAIFAKEALHISRAVIIAPSNVGETWRNYLTDDRNVGGYFKEGKAPNVLRVNQLEDLKRDDLQSFDYVLISQERLRDEYVNVLKEYDFGMMIVDESHKLKNPKGKRGEQIIELSKHLEEKDGYLALLSGTPVPNTVQDVGMVLRLLYPEKFRDMNDRSLATQIIRGDLVDLRSLLLPRMQMKSLQESVEMPMLTEQVKRIPLTESEQEIYDILLEEDEITATQKMKLMRQFLLNPETVDPTPDIVSTKIETVSKALHDAFRTKKKVVLFVNGYVENIIRGEGSIIEKLHLPKDVRVEVVHGEVAEGDRTRGRAEIQERFQYGDEKMLLVVSGQTADVGVDYSAGEAVFFYNEPWTEPQRRQQLSRVYRPGLAHDLSSTTFLMEGTLEEGIHRHLAAKYKSIKKLLHGIPLAELEKQMLEKSDTSPSVPGLEVNPDLADYYFSSWDKLLQMFAYVKDIGEPDFQKFLERFSRDYADSYLDMGSRSYQANASRVNAMLVVDALRKQKSGKEARIIDLASGPEMLRKHIADEWADKVVSVDINADHFRGKDGGTRVVGSMVHLPMRDESFDVANLSLAMHYASFAPSKGQFERLQVLMEMQRVLKMGGRAIINNIYSLDVADEAAFRRISELVGFRLIEEESGEVVSGNGYQSRVYFLEKIGGEQRTLDELKKIVQEEKLDRGLKFRKNDHTIKDQRRLISSFSLAGKERPITLNEKDQRIFEEEKKLTNAGRNLKDRFGSIELIPRDEVEKSGFSRVFNGKRYVLFKRLITGPGAVVVK